MTYKRKNGEPASIIEKLIKRARYASVYNLAVPLHKRAKSARGYWEHAYNVCRELEEQGRIIPVKSYGDYNLSLRSPRTPVFEKFYQLAGNDREHGFVAKIHPRTYMHQSALVDVVLSFLTLYPNHEVFVDYSPNLGVKYTPDAKITMIDESGKKSYFYIELERTRSFEYIKKDKIEKVEEILPESMIEKSAKILIVYLHEEYNPYWRPVEYDELADEVSRQRAKFEKLLKVLKGSPDRYRFMNFTNFYKLNEAVWFDSRGNKSRLL